MSWDFSSDPISIPCDGYTVLPGTDGWEIHFNGQTIGLRSNRSDAIHAAIAAANNGARGGLRASVLLGDGEGTAYPVWQSWVDGYSAVV
jgi:hypothetical protein